MPDAAAKAKADAAAKAKAEADAKRRALAEAKRKADAEAKKKADAEAKKFDLNKTADLLKNLPDDGTPQDMMDKDPKKRGATAAAADQTSKTAQKGPVAGTKNGTDTKLTAQEKDMLTGIIQSALTQCWRKPAVGSSEQAPVVTIKWRLKQDGTLDGQPQVVDRVTTPMAEAAAQAAVRAVISCNKFDLPPDKYAAWREITWEFDPNKK